MEMTISDLQKIPHLDCSDLRERAVIMMPVWDGTRWSHWVPTDKGWLEMHPSDTVLGDYLAKSAARPSDLWVPFIDLMWQQASWPDVCHHISAISDDFHNMSTAAAKIRHFYDTRDLLKHGVAASFVETEIEYILTLCRGVFDLLQEALSVLWNNHILLVDENGEQRRKHRSLPETFSKLVLKEKRSLKTQEDIEREYALPPVVAEQYAKCAPFFSRLRDARDNIVHRGHSSPIVFVTEKGFCVSPNAKAFRGFDGWRDEHIYNVSLVSLLPWLADTILQTIYTCNNITAALAKQIAFPPELAPGYRIFIRGYNSQALADLLSVQRGGTAWWTDKVSRVTTDGLDEASPHHQDVELAAYYRYLDRIEHGQAGSPMDDWLEAERESHPRAVQTESSAEQT